MLSCEMIFYVLYSKQCLPQIQSHQMVNLFKPYNFWYSSQPYEWFELSLTCVCSMFRSCQWTHRLKRSWPHKFDCCAGNCCYLHTGCWCILCLQKVSTPNTYIWQSTVLWGRAYPTGCGWHQQTDRECRNRKPWAYYNLVIHTSLSSIQLTIQLDVLKPLT